ncbi:MAG TPA: hypothetical protein DEF68_05310, partial [Elusimicrobia bacterium]|nr:hypothetical protein [Elusimicrobiota bacterium]
MANEYNELEQLVNDVTNIDTARMTLRWALERLNAIEKEKAELKKNLDITEGTRKGLEIKVQSLEDTFKSRGKSLEEKESFYAKLEATMALLGDGKLDIQQLLKKEARLDHLRLELENEYQDKFEELDKNQNSVIERWNQRLLDVEGQYAKRLSEAQARYDALRQELEADYQSRLGTLDTSYQRKEKELTERIKTLEISVKAGEAGLEGRRKELETDFLGKKNEIEANYLKLKSLLESGFQERIRSAENDHCAQVKSLERTWNAERERLMAEQHARDEQFKKSQEEMARLEGQLSAQQERHHSELIDIISRKEEAFRAKVEDLEKEKAAYESAVEKLRLQLEAKEKDWLTQKEQVYAEFAQRCSDMDASVRERTAALERDYSGRKDELESIISAAKEKFEKDASARVEVERRAMEEEKARLVEDGRLKDSALGRADASIKELEKTFSASREEHHRELMAKIRVNEEAFRAKLAEFEAEKEEYKTVIARLVGEAGAKDGVFIEEKKRLQNEFNEKYASLEAELSARDAKAGETEETYEARLSALGDSFKEKEKAWVLERERLTNELTVISNDAQALAAERVEKIKAAYETRKAELETQFEEKLASASAALEFEKERINGELAAVRTELGEMAARAKELGDELSADRRAHHEELMAKLADKEAALKAQAGSFDKELALKDEAAGKQAREFAAREKQWAGEKEALSADFAARFQLLEKGLAERESALELQYRVKTGEMEKNAAEVRSLLETDFKQKLAVEKRAFEDAKASLIEENRLKEERLSETRALAAERVEKIKSAYESRKAELEKQYEDKLASASAALAFEKARLVADLKTASDEHTRLTEEFKELERTIASDRRAHHAELMEKLADKEAALKAQAGNFVKELALKDEAAGKQAHEFAAREKQWSKEKQELSADFAARFQLLEKGLAERESALELQYRVKAGEMDKNAAEVRSLLEADFRQRLDVEKQAFEDAKASLIEENRLKERQLSETRALAAERVEKIKSAYESRKAEIEKQFDDKLASASAALAFEKARMVADLKTASVEYTKLSGQFKELEETIASDRRAHHAELMAKLAEKEDALKAQADGFTKELNKQRSDFNAREAALSREKEAALKTQSDTAGGEILKLRDRLSSQAAAWAMEREKMQAAMAEAAARAERETKERVSRLASDYEAKKAELTRILNERLAEKETVLRLETAKVIEESRLKDAQLSATHERVKELENKVNAMSGTHHEELMARLAEKEEALKVQADELNREKASALEAQAADFDKELDKLRESSGVRESALADKNEKLGLALKEAAARAEREIAETAARLKAVYESRKTELEKQYEEKLASATAALAFEKARMVSDLKTASVEYTKLSEQFKDLEGTIASDRRAHHAELMAKLADKESALKTQAGNFNKELAGLRDAFGVQAAAWAAEKEKLNSMMAETSARAEREIKERAMRTAAEYENKKAELERILNERLAEKESVLRLETAKVMEESRLKDGQLSATHERVKELENKVNAMSGEHHEELMARLAEKEAALKAQADELNREKASALQIQAGAFEKELAARESALNKQAQELSAKEKYWSGEKEALAADFAARFQLFARDMAEREKALELQYRAKEAEVNRTAAQARAQAEMNFAERLAAEKDNFEKAKARQAEEAGLKDAQLSATHNKLKELEKRMGELKDVHHAEAMARQAEKEAALKAQAENFGKELAGMQESFKAKLAALAREQEEALKAQAGNSSSEILKLRERLNAQASAWTAEKEKLNSMMAETSVRAEREIKERAMRTAAEYENKKAELERILNERLA